MACSKSVPRPLPAPVPQRPEIDTLPHMPAEVARDTVPRDTTTPMPHALPVQSPWADSVLKTLSLRAKVSQLVVRWVPGNATPGSAQMDKMLGWVRDDSIGGVIVGVGTAAQVARTTNALQSVAPLPLLVAADLEFGAGQRVVPEGTSFPYPMGMAATRDTMLSCAQGRITAREARAVGINWTLTPDVDLNTKPDNPSIGVRAYSDDAAVVERYAPVFIRCVQEGGMLATAKHLVGTGGVSVDTHLARAVLDADRERLDTAELVMFRVAQRAGVAAMMSAHVAIPRVTGDSLPASLSPSILKGIVRHEWGYDGLIVTDALWMKGVGGDSPGAVAVHAVVAGNDVLLDPADHKEAIDSIVAAVGAGTLSEARIDSAVRRVLKAKEKLSLNTARTVDSTALAAAFGTKESDSVATLAARQSMSLARDRGNAIWRLSRAKRVLAVLYLDEGKEPNPGTQPGVAFTTELGSLLKARGQKLDVVTLTKSSTNSDVRAAADRASDAEAVVLAHYARPVAEKGYAGVPPRIASMTKKVIQARPNAIVVSFGDPYMERQFPAVGTYLLAWNPLSAWSERAAARAVAGKPAHDTTVAQAVADTLRAILENFRADSAFPGAYAAVGTHAGVIASVSVGTVDWNPSTAVDDSVMWDLASLTKVIGMTTAIEQLVAAGKVDLDAKVQRYLPRWKDPKRWRGPKKSRVTVRDLLTHRSGLPAWRPLHKEGVGPDSAMRLVYLTPLDTTPRVRMVYSDLGAILLGQIVEKVSKQKLDVYLRRHVFTPLGMKETRFRPDTLNRSRIAPTEYDSFRQRLIWGIVHDENSFALGGVAGHAGLFSSGRDLSRFARMYLNFGTIDGTQILKPSTIYQFQRLQDSSFSNRAIGWEKPTGNNSAGRRMSPAAFGHTGFTGTSIWMDPANDVFVILLTNRVNPTRQNTRVYAARTAIADAALSLLATVRQASVTLTPQAPRPPQ